MIKISDVTERHCVSVSSMLEFHITLKEPLLDVIATFSAPGTLNSLDYVVVSVVLRPNTYKAIRLKKRIKRTNYAKQNKDLLEIAVSINNLLDTTGPSGLQNHKDTLNHQICFFLQGCAKLKTNEDLLLSVLQDSI